MLRSSMSEEAFAHPFEMVMYEHFPGDSNLVSFYVRSASFSPPLLRVLSLRLCARCVCVLRDGVFCFFMFPLQLFFSFFHFCTFVLIFTQDRNFYDGMDTKLDRLLQHAKSCERAYGASEVYL